MSMRLLKKNLQVEGVQEDRISHLPDEIICRILSLIPARYSIRTTVLSNRWERLWIFAPKLDFEFSRYDYPSHLDENDNCEAGFLELCMDSFTNSLNNLLLLRGNLCIESFRLSYVWCHNETDRIPANALLCRALACNILELDLKTKRHNEAELPQMLFTCKTLVVLKLNSEFVIDVLHNVCLPNLKTLVLNHVICLGDESVSKLLSGCSVLEDLKLRRDDRGCSRVSVYDVSHPTMKRLTLQVGDMDDDADDLPRTIIVNSPNLEYINLEGSWPGDFMVCYLPSVAEAHINIDHYHLYGDEEDIEHGKKLLAFLISIAHVERLFITHVQFISFLHVIAPDLPKFCNLVSLEISVVSNNFPILLMGFLESSPKLEVLTLPRGFLFDRFLMGAESGWHKPQRVPESLLHSVKSIHIHSFWGREDELNIVKYFLENTMKLEKMTVFCNQYATSVRFFELQIELKTHPRGSLNCQLDIVHR